MLPTKTSTGQFRGAIADEKGDLHYGMLAALVKGHVPQHVYFTSNEEKKEGDWVTDGINVSYCDSSFWNQMLYLKQNYTVRYNSYKKIASATDASLNIPAIPQEWVRTKFVPANGKVDKVTLRKTRVRPNASSAFPDHTDDVWGLKLTSNNEVVIVDEPKIVKIEGDLPKNNHDGTMSITPLVAVYEDGCSRSDDVNPEKLLEDATKKDWDENDYSTIKYTGQDKARHGRIFRAGWKANPNKWTDDMVYHLITIMGGSWADDTVKAYISQYKKTRTLTSHGVDGKPYHIKESDEFKNFM